MRAAHHWAFLPAGPPGLDPRRGRTASATAGVSGVLVPQIFAPPWAALGAAAACDEDIELASGIAMAFVRSPLETAMAALDLDRLSGGPVHARARQQRAGVERRALRRRLRPPRGPAARARRRSQADGHARRAARIGRFEGEFWHVDLDGIRLPRPIRPTLPITLAPLRAAMTEMAAEVADGILGHPVWSPRWITGEVRAAVERGLARAGRQRSDLRITAWLRVAITDDIEQGRDDARVGHPVLRVAAPVRLVLRGPRSGRRRPPAAGPRRGGRAARPSSRPRSPTRWSTSSS